MGDGDKMGLPRATRPPLAAPAGASLALAIAAAILARALHAAWPACFFALPAVVGAAVFGWRGAAAGAAVGLALFHGAVVVPGLAGYGAAGLAGMAATLCAAALAAAARSGSAKPAAGRAQDSELERTNRRLAAVNAVAAAFDASPAVDEAAAAVLSQTLAAVGCSIGAVLFVGKERARPELVAHSGLSEPLDPDRKRALGEMARRVTKGGRPVVIGDLAAEAALAALAGAPSGARSAAAVPLRAAGAVIGTLCVASPAADPLPDAELALLVEVADRLGAAVSQVRRVEEAVRRAAEVEEALALEKELLPERLQSAQVEGTLQTMRAVQDRINNPLMVIVTSAELLEMRCQDLPPEVRTTLARIVKAAQQIADVNGRLARITIPVSTSSAVGQMLDMERSERVSRAPSKKIEEDTEYDLTR